MTEKNIKICTNCVMDNSDPEIKFDKNGRCDFCDNYYNSILPTWKFKNGNKKELFELAEKIKKEGTGKGKKYDCVIGLSGGVDSCYLAYIVKKKLGLNPIMVSIDTGWNLNIANENIKKLLEKLKLDSEIIKVNWEEMADLQLSFLKSQVPYNDLPQDHAIFAGIYNYSVKHGIKYVLTGANLATECVQPPYEWVYFNDLKLIKDIHKKFGKVKLNTFPMCSMFKYRLYYRYFKGLKVVHPLNMIDYNKKEAIKILEKEIGWTSYENKHYEDIFTRFYEGYWLPNKFGYDKRKCYYSSEILTGQMDRTEALSLLKNQPYDEKIALEDMEYISNKLGITIEEFKKIMNMPNKTFRDYKNSEKIIKFAIKLAKIFGIEKRNFR